MEKIQAMTCLTGWLRIAERIRVRISALQLSGMRSWKNGETNSPHHHPFLPTSLSPPSLQNPKNPRRWRCTWPIGLNMGSRWCWTGTKPIFKMVKINKWQFAFIYWLLIGINTNNFHAFYCVGESTPISCIVRCKCKKWLGKVRKGKVGHYCWI